MVRRRGRPRRSFAYLRIRRYRLKYMHQILPIRFKLLLPPMHKKIGEELTKYDYLEKLVFSELYALGIPEHLWDDYMAWAKKKGEVLTKFTDETLQKETDLLMQEFILRGLDKDILAQLEPIVDEWGGIPVPLEGNYTSWSQKWLQTYHASEFDWNELVRIDEALNKIFTQSVSGDCITERVLADGSNPTVTPFINVNAFGGSVLAHPWSILRKYFAYIRNEGGVPKLKIYKDGSLKQTIDLSLPPTSWIQIGMVYYISFSPDGKYILIDNTSANEYALFQGS